MDAQERLRLSIAEHERRLRASVPLDREAAVLALLRVVDRLPDVTPSVPTPDTITGRRIANLGLNKALRLCLDAADAAPPFAPLPNGEDSRGWAERFLRECDHLAETETVLSHCETGFMRLVAGSDGTFHAWIATKQPPTSWLERADVDWWAAWLARRYEAELRSLRSQHAPSAGSDAATDTSYRQLADAHVRLMSYQLGYPPDAVIAGCTVQNYRDVLSLLIAWALAASDRGEPLGPQSESALVRRLAGTLSLTPEIVARALSAFTLDGTNAAHHAAVPGVAPAPLVRVRPDRIIGSLHGLTTEPLFFLSRELRRRTAQEYHNTATLREDVFRQDLYALFQDKRFVTSAGRIKVRREDGDLRTDIDAVVFDRKSGSLGIFELKSQDPFTRSAAELARQRDAFLAANRQVSGVLDWIKRSGADEILNRVDRQTAKKFRVQKVYPFVLGRYVAHFSGGAAPDRRAAWGTWPQILRLLGGQPVRVTDPNPLASLFTRLSNDVPVLTPPADAPPREIAIGDARLSVHSSYAAFRAATEHRPAP